MGESEPGCSSGPVEGAASDDGAPPYAIPAIGEAIRACDEDHWGHTMAAVYLGYERVSDDFFMHRVRSIETGAETLLPPHLVYRPSGNSTGPQWESLAPWPWPR